ncbi:hypothetical protein [Methanonatronarchaeum sp. AMET-Sl]|uniref:hypothetical protein n=1 Tax=Methanonatronarchaeum sp. AMET-Sl TaxID=3037654 RepID=UPI00244E181A|nr:hypothetical protein [Methanonatronarchaeum sp. AMET-Sl]WGI17636.1 hypothetical protein QEN48_01100 [Methanonatronarchaeum sp. AMET-Sl]
MRIKDRIVKIYQVEGFFGVISAVYRYSKVKIKNPRSIRSFINYFYCKSKYRSQFPSRCKIIKVNPIDIKYKIHPRFSSRYLKRFSYIFSGNWDINRCGAEQKSAKNNRCLVPFKNSTRYESYKRHFKNGVPWEETEFYENKKEKIKNHSKSHPRYGSIKKFKKNYLKEIDRLYHSIKKGGFKTQDELKKEGETPSIHNHKLSFKEEILINIGRDGKLIFDDGRNRVCIAKILGIKEIPVRVFVRHKKWQKLRNEIINSGSIKELSKRAKNHLNHPDINELMKNS